MQGQGSISALLLASFVALGALPSSTLAQAISQDSLRRVGQEVLREHVQEFGIDTDPEFRRDVGQILTRLRGVSGFEGPRVEWEIIRDTTLNAAAAPGGVMVINSGLGRYCRAFTNTASAARPIRARYEGCLGAVLGHEFAHITLGHVDSLAATVYRRQQIDQHMENVSSVAEALRDQVISGGLKVERGQELEADRVGSLYLLRGGWQIQDMMDLFRAFDSVARKAGLSRDVGQITWLRDHPRSSEREARLEEFRATLKLAQRDFDDALTLVNNGVMLDSAVVMLDRVLKVFPDLTAARHARAAALHQQWLEATPVKTRQLQASVATYSKWFIPGIRGGNVALLNDARGAYRTVLAKQAHPYTISNLAVLDAYAGDLASAQKRADESLRMKPSDPFVLNNRGVVLFLAGKQGEAARAFEAGIDAAPDSVVNAAIPALLFNYGKTLALLKDPRASRYLDAYLEIDEDDRSEWRREAIALRGGPAGTAVPPAATAPSTKSVPPPIGGVRLGDAKAAVIKILGPPDESETVQEGVLWHYGSRGLLIGVDPQGGVALLALLTPTAGDIDGVRVGDTAKAATAKWGNPSDVGQDDTMIFDRGGWLLHVAVEGGLILAIGITLP